MKQVESTRELLGNYYQQHCDELRAYARARVGRDDLAEDMVQNVFLKLLLMKMITRVTLPNLVYTVLRNQLFDYWRHRKAVEEYEHLLLGRWRQEEGVLSPESVYSVQEITELLERGIAQLTEKQRQVYVLSVYDSMKVSEISETLHLNYKSVENRLGEARKQVRHFMRTRLAG